jgi:hypothetical protein
MGASPQTPGIYRIDANPEVSRRDLKGNGVSLETLRLGLGRWSALRLLPSIALSSAQARDIVFENSAS